MFLCHLSGCGLLSGKRVFYWIWKRLYGTSFGHKNDQFTPAECKPTCQDVHQLRHRPVLPPLPPPASTPFLPLKYGHCKWPENTGIWGKVRWFLQGRAGTATTVSEPRSPLRQPRGYPHVFPSPLFIYFITITIHNSTQHSCCFNGTSWILAFLRCAGI